MIIFEEGDDIFKVDANIYVITVNCIGVMGKGLAKSFRVKYPELYERYKRDCRKGTIGIGRPVIYEHESQKRFMMFPTKLNWRNPSRYDYISSSLQWIKNAIGTEISPTDSIVMPPLGCHNGGLSFEMVSLTIAEVLQSLDNLVIVVYPWHEHPHHSLMAKG